MGNTSQRVLCRRPQDMDGAEQDYHKNEEEQSSGAGLESVDSMKL